ncbi:type IV secretory system conjugative DNA transfer family protein [Nitrosomonas sp. JL21]|uniref:type IV secretory system conjugative DNA transfer family protein n=1 Tax=Nitrosomonas sp. JL21 TaxID=153949 RepID=UPI00136CAED3|nr:type IV secretory system conjugative DNA transfer family protein [Nitrosomonas sp. JL21]MXS77909.1 type IV secretory system conjugative DNA transfer family protein [Nitrosomonas sp. JL21]
MSHYSNNQHPTSLLTLLCVTVLLVGWSNSLPLPMMAGRVVDWFSALIHFMAGLFCLHTAIRLLENLSHYIDLFGSRKVSGQKGTSAWAKVKEYKDALTKDRRGPFWGCALDGPRPALFFDFASNAMTVAPAGSGKGIYNVVPNIMSTRKSKVVADFKGELSCLCKSALEARGEIVRVLNPGNLWSEIIGKSDSYNPLDIIADDLTRPGGLRDINDDLRELGMQIQPEPGEKETDNSYFREGGRFLIGLGSLSECMVDLHDATLSSVALLLENPQRLEDTARWLAGVDMEGKPHPDGPFPIEHTEWAKVHDPRDVAEFAKLVRAKAHNLITLISDSDKKTYLSFVTGAQQSLSVFAFGRLALAMGRSTFSMNDLKEGDKPTTLFIVADASRMEAYKAYVGLMQWCCLTAMKRHPNKERPLYCILDEASNYKINGLESLLTWGRSYGLRLHLIFQDLAAFERVYGKTALDTLMSETEIKQFLPGQRSPKTLEMISKQMLGEQSVMAMSGNRSIEHLGLNETISEVGRLLATPDEIRRMKEGILFVRQHRPILFEPVSYAEIEPWRSQVGINPFHGKPFRKKIKLRL